jgi:hypothetical protein
MANLQKSGSPQRNIPSSEPFRTDFRINSANFFGTDNSKYSDINTGESSLPEASSFTDNDFIVIILFTLSNNLMQMGFTLRIYFLHIFNS